MPSYTSDFLNAQGSKNWQNIAQDYSAFSGDKLIVDTSSGLITVTLPQTPAIGDTVEFSDGSDFSLAGKQLIVTTGNFFTIQAFAEDLVVDSKNASFALTFNGINDWRLTET